MKKKVLLVPSLILAVILFFIFFNSFMNNSESNMYSGFFVKLVYLITPKISFLEWKIPLEVLIRKLAHVVEFSVLGACVMLLIRYIKKHYNKSCYLISVFLLFLVSLLDELIQSFSDRSNSFFDVLLDFVSALIGLFVMFLIFKIYDKLKIRRKNTLKDSIDNNVTEKEVEMSHHHSHHSHHHSSHHSHSSSNREKKEKLKIFFEKNKKRLFNIAVFVLIIVIFISVAVIVDKGKNNKTYNENTSTLSTSNSIMIEVPFFTEEIITVSDAVVSYMNSDSKVTAKDIYSKFGDMEDVYSAKPVKISFNISGLPTGITLKSSNVLISEEKDFGESISYNIDVSKKSVNIYNVKSNTTYFYRIDLEFDEGMVSSATGSFKTENYPRILNVGGISNVRDIGGYETKSGKLIKQGLLFRGSELDGAVKENFKITQKGIDTLLNELKIRTDMDLRSSFEVEEFDKVLGSSVNHKFYGVPMYDEIFKEENKESVKTVFDDLSQKDNYPIYLHCTHGMDRAGTISYLLLALLGVEEDILMKEYQLSGLCYGSVDLAGMQKLTNELNEFDGSTLSDKTEAYLLSIGVTKHQIDNIKDIFIQN